MSFRAPPLFPGDMYDAALRLAASPDAPRAQGQRATQPSAKWQQMIELGWQGVVVAEADGGAGGSLQDLAAIVEAAARYGQLAPLVDRCAVAPLLLASGRSNPAVAEVLANVAMGEASVCTAVDSQQQTPGAASQVALGSDGVLMGALRAVDLTEPASHVLFTASSVAGATPVLILLPFAQLTGAARHYVGVDGRQFSDFVLDGIAVAPESVVLRGEAVTPVLASAQQAGNILSCVEAVGAAAAMIELTIEYLNTRVQFGVHLSTFQALRHKVVDMYVAYENSSGLIRRQVLQADQSGIRGYPRDVALARLYVLSVSRAIAENAIQLHGGMGMTWEMLAARLAMRSLGESLQFGNRGDCLDWLVNKSLAEAAIA